MAGWQADERGIDPAVEYLAFSTGKGKVSPVMVLQRQGMFGSPSSLGYVFVLVTDIRARTDLDKGFNWHHIKATTMLHEKIRYEDAFGQTYITQQRVRATIERLSPI